MPYCTLEEAWNVEIYPDDEQDTLKSTPQPEKYGYPNKIYEPNPTPMDIPRPQFKIKEHLSEFEQQQQLSVPISNQYSKLIEDLKGENRKLKDKIQELEKLSNKQQDKDSLFDVILYISTGIFVIFMMENISNMGRRY
jgi:hypothetical protein